MKRILSLILFCVVPTTLLAQQTIDQLSAGAPLSGTEQIPIFQTANPAVTTTPNALKTYIGGGTVTSISSGCASVVNPNPITTTGTIAASEVVNLQTGANYLIANADCGKLVQLSNGANQVPTIAQAGGGGSYVAGWFVDACNIGAGTQTITPVTSTIGGASTYVLPAGTAGAPQCIKIVSNGTNYDVVKSQAGSSTITAGTTATSGITTTHLISSTTNLIADSGIVVSNVPLLNAANTFTAAQAITAPANTTALTLTGYSLTAANTQPMINLTGTLNTSGAPDIIAMAITDTSGSGGNLIGLKAGAGGNSYMLRVSMIGDVNAAGALTTGGNINVGNVLLFNNSGGTYLSNPAAATIQLGLPDAASPTAHTLKHQSVSAGTSNTVGTNWTFAGSRGTGTGVGGDIIFQTAKAGTTGTAQNTLASAFTVKNTGVVQNNIVFSAAGTPLPTCNGAAEGSWASVSDSTGPTYNNAYTSGGTIHVPVYCDGTSWKNH